MCCRFAHFYNNQVEVVQEDDVICVFNTDATYATDDDTNKMLAVVAVLKLNLQKEIHAAVQQAQR